MNIQFNANMAGKMCNAPKGAWRLNLADGSLGQVTAYAFNGDYSDTEFALTGWYITKNGITYYQEDGGYWVEWSADATLYADVPSRHSTDATYRLINGIITNNKRILENNLLCAKYASKFTDAQKGRLYDLQLRLQNRNTLLQNKSLIQSATTSYPKGYVTWASELDSFMSYGRVGSVTTIAVIVVSVIVIASLMSAAYYAYKYYYSESEKDVKYSDELTSILAQKLTAEEFEALKSETAGMITKAKLTARVGSMASYAKYVLYGFAGFLIYKIAYNSTNNKK